jgi:hypothetical protein
MKKDPDAAAGSANEFVPIEITRRAAILSRDVEPMRDGCVFQTEHEGGRATWVLAQYQRDPRLPQEGVPEGGQSAETARVQYVVVSPESHVARIRIDLRADPTATRAEIIYEFTGLTERGNLYVSRHTPEYFAAWIHDWKVAIEHYLRTGETLRSGKEDQTHH